MRVTAGLIVLFARAVECLRVEWVDRFVWCVSCLHPLTDFIAEWIKHLYGGGLGFGLAVW